MDQVSLPDGLPDALCRRLEAVASRLHRARAGGPAPPSAGDAAGAAQALALLDALLRTDLEQAAGACDGTVDAVRRAAAALTGADLGVAADLPSGGAWPTGLEGAGHPGLRLAVDPGRSAR